jgi:hypothetical protein
LEGGVMVHGLYVVPTTDYYIGADALDGNFDKIKVVDKTPDGGTLVYGYLSGRAVDPALMPTKMRWLGGKVKIPDFTGGRCVCVSERAKALIERFEPDVHQFIPVDYYYGTSDVKERRYFFICCNRIDSLDHPKTTFVLKHIVTTTGVDVSYWVPIQDLVRNGEQDLIPPHLTPKTNSKFVFSLAKIGKMHLWCDKFMMGGGGPWLSDILADAIVEAGLTGIQLPNKSEAV